MCLCPRSIKTKSDYIYSNGGQFYDVTVSCGHCAECSRAKLNEYYLRSYYQASEALDSLGFVYFDTLTYDNDHLPSFSSFLEDLKGSPLDFPCFDYRHIRLFLVLLRQRLARLGYKSDAFKYFLSSEYGTDPRFTHRPHYHVIFYVLCDIDPLIFSRLVSECWPHGRTDGLPYQSRFYVRDHIFSRNSVNIVDTSHLENLCLYVAKYVTKSSQFDKYIAKRVELVCSHYRSLNYILTDSEYKEIRRTLYRHASQFHRQSNGFGLYALSSDSYDQIFRSGILRVPSTDGYKYYPLPCYFRRKLFYQLIKDHGKLRWIRNSEGVRFDVYHAIQSRNNLAMNFSSWRSNLNVDDQDIVNNLLDGRSFSDFANYILFFRGRVRPFDVFHDVDLDSFLASPLDWLKRLYSPPSGIAFDNSLSIYDDVNKLLGTSFVSLRDFTDRCIINDSSSPYFHDYDKLYAFYSSSLEPVNAHKQSIHDYLNVLRERHKDFSNNQKPFNYGS